MLRLRSALFVGGLLLLHTVSIVAAAQPDESKSGPFLISTEAQLNNLSAGCLMICPSHAYGTADNAERILKQALDHTPADKTSTIVICRFMQTETLKRFAPLVRRVVIEPFAAITSKTAPREDNAAWPGSTSPVLQKLSEIRTDAGRVLLVALLNVNGEPGIFGDRTVAFEELQWQMLAIVGSGYQGIAWRGNLAAVPFEGRLRRFQQQLQSYSNSIGGARSVKWASTLDVGQPIASLASADNVFIVLLNRNYFVLSNDLDGRDSVRMPFHAVSYDANIQLNLPPNLTFKSARTLGGAPVETKLMSAGHVNLLCRLSGGGEMLICNVNR